MPPPKKEAYNRRSARQITIAIVCIKMKLGLYIDGNEGKGGTQEP